MTAVTGTADTAFTPCDWVCGKDTDSFAYPCGCGSVNTCANCGCCKGCGQSAKAFCGWDCRKKTESFPFPCGCGTRTTCLVCGRCRGCGNGEE